MTDQPPRLVDMFGSLPTPERVAFEIRSWGSEPGYRELFGARFAENLGIPAEVVHAVAELPAESYGNRAVELLTCHLQSEEELVAQLRSQGAILTVLHNLLPTQPGLTNDALAELVSRHPSDLIGFVRIDPTRPEVAAEEVRRGIVQLGLRGATMSPFWHRIRANDPALRPIYETCCELGIPIWIHTGVNWSRGSALSWEHPSYLDEIAVQYPELVLIAGHGGWPWVAEMVTVAWRHPNVYIDFSAHRPRHLAVPGSGWEMLWYAISRTLKDKVVFGSTWQLLGLPLKRVLAEVRELGLDPAIERKWLVENAGRILHVDLDTGGSRHA